MQREEEKVESKGAIAITIWVGSSTYLNTEYQGTSYHFHLKQMGEKWYKANVILETQDEQEAVNEIFRIHKGGLLHMFNEVKKIA